MKRILQTLAWLVAVVLLLPHLPVLALAFLEDYLTEKLNHKAL